MSFLGKAIVVTGGASGIGKALVNKLLQQSATVHVLDLNSHIPTHGESTPGRQYSYPSVDVSSRGQVKATFDKIFAANENKWVDGLVNCAGLLRMHPYTTDSAGDDTMSILWKVNVMGPWHTCTEIYERLQAFRQASPSLGNNKESFAKATTSIVNVGSMASCRGLNHMAPYVASKHAVHGLTRAFAQDFGPAGFRVNSVGPGSVLTPMVADLPKADPISAAPYCGAFRTHMQPEEIADGIIYLLGDGSSAVSGQLLEMNGGWP